MKKIIQVVSSLLIVTMFTCLQSQAQLKLIYYWNFDNTLPCGGGSGVNDSPIYADYSDLGTAVLVYDNSQTTPQSCDCASRDSIVDNGTSTDTLNIRNGYTTNNCSGDNSLIKLRNPSNNMNFLWYLPTTKFSNILIKYDTQASSTTSGQAYQVLDYSLDSGSTFSTAGLVVSSNPPGTSNDTVIMANYVTPFGTISLDLSAVSGANNNPKFVVRLRFATVDSAGMIISNDTNPSGNNRIDNLTVEGDSLTTGINEITASQGYSIYPNPANDLLNITSNHDGDKVISIFNVVGQLVTSFISTDRQIPVNIMQFSSGIYCLNIREINGGNSYTAKFVKN